MPPAIVAVFAAVGVTVSLTTASWIATAALFAINIAMKLLTKKPKGNPAPPAVQTMRMERAPRRYAIGRTMFGGVEVFVEARKVTNNSLYQVIALCDGPISAFEQIWLDDSEVELNKLVANPNDVNGTGEGEGGLVQKPQKRWLLDGNKQAVFLWQYRGTLNQKADQNLMQAFPGTWTANHRLLGVAYLVLKFNSIDQATFQKVYRGGQPPKVRSVIRGMGSYDPRDIEQDPASEVTWKWSRNASLAILSFLIRPMEEGGVGIPSTLVDMQAFAEFADVCDELIVKADGTSEPRWCIDGNYASTDDPKDILADMQMACAAQIFEDTDGQIAIRGGRWQAPTVFLGPNDIVATELERGPDVFTGVNWMKVAWISPDHQYAKIEGIEVKLEDKIAEAGRVVYGTTELEMVVSHHQARRIANIELNRTWAGWRGKVTTTLRGIAAWDHHNILLTVPWCGITDPTPFRVERRTLSADARTIEWEVIQTSEAEYDAPVEANAPALAPPSDEVPRIRQPRLILVRTDPDGASLAKLTFWVPLPPRRDEMVMIQYWINGQATVNTTTTAAGSFSTLSGNFQTVFLPVGQSMLVVPGLTPGASIRYWAKYYTPNGYQSDWSTAYNESTGATTVPSIAASRTPTPVYPGTYSVNTGVITFGPPSDYSIVSSKVWFTGTSAVFARTTLVRSLDTDPGEGSVFPMVMPLTTGTNHFWFEHFDINGNTVGAIGHAWVTV